MCKKLCFVVILIFPLAGLKSQQISNIKAKQSDDSIIISYSLNDYDPNSNYEIDLYCSTDGGVTFYGPLKAVSGNVGSGVKPGINLLITWNVFSEFEHLQSKDVVFEVRGRKSDMYLMDMVFVKGGIYTMGCTSEQTDCENDEIPSHQVALYSYYIGKYEITQLQWLNVMGSYPSESTFFRCDECPITNVSWFDVQLFIIKLNQVTGKNYRLPTEAEWEYAAKGGQLSKKYQYSGSNSIENVGWYWKNSGKYPLDGEWNEDKIVNNSSKSRRIGTKHPNELGIYDLTGNVWEFCSDWYGLYQPGFKATPQGPQAGERKIIRGGSWFEDSKNCRVTVRNKIQPESVSNHIGFRLAHDE